MIGIERGARATRALFVLTILAGSFLLFLVEPLVARLALPRLGGAAAVWNSAMLVYQALLLAGYGYAHALGRVGPRVQRLAHLALMLVAALWLPIGLLGWELPPDASPALWVPWLFGLSIGPLFLVTAAQAPLLQRWYAIAQPGADPYPLYAASNLGSFAGLIAYPLLVEPWLALPQQRWLWSAGYLGLAALTVAASARLPRERTRAAAPSSPRPGAALVARWVVLAFVPSALMLATSTYITTDIVAMPLLWVLPLGLYLLSFSVAFAARRGFADAVTAIAPLVILFLGGVMMGGYQPRASFGVLVALTLLFAAATALHTVLYRARPAPDRLTAFYLAIAAGGALGGVFAALLAPAMFNWTWEYPLMILAAGLLAPMRFPFEAGRRLWRGGWRLPATLAVAGLVAALLVLRVRGVAGFGDNEPGNAYLVVGLLGMATFGARAAFGLVLAGALLIFGGYASLAASFAPGVRARSYFGVYTTRDQTGERVLVNGTTIHGIELTGSPARERTLTTYYVPGSGIGRVMAALRPLYGPGARVGVVGLGSGTLACYAKPGQSWRFYEIDPEMVRIARARFRFLADCLPNASVTVGDARLTLARARAASVDLLALDAFSSDAIPIHLMTREAFATYARVVAPRGLLLAHVSNRFVDLEPVVAAAAREGGWGAIKLSYTPPEGAWAQAASEWIALSRDPAALATLARDDATWTPLTPRPGITAWERRLRDIAAGAERLERHSKVRRMSNDTDLRIVAARTTSICLLTVTLDRLTRWGRPDWW